MARMLGDMFRLPSCHKTCCDGRRWRHKAAGNRMWRSREKAAQRRELRSTET